MLLDCGKRVAVRNPIELRALAEETTDHLVVTIAADIGAGGDVALARSGDTLPVAAMKEPATSRPHMPGYGIRPANEGSGLLSWGWAEQQLQTSHNFWVITLWPDGRPHAMPVWGVWDDDDLFWFTSAVQSRKVLNIANDPRCSVATEDEQRPVILNGDGEIRTSPGEIAHVIELVNGKYGTDYGTDFLDPAKNATIRVRTRWALGLDADDFTGSPTRWTFA